jgi:surface protein
MATAFAVYSFTDQSLSFYKRDSIPEIGSEFEGKLVTKIYTGFEDSEYTTGSASPFYGDRNIIKLITFVDVITPISTAYWFYNLGNVEAINNCHNLNTSNVANMKYMFGGVCDLRSLDLSGLDVSNVTDMSHMFSGCNLLQTLNVSNFNTSNVTNMSRMFSGCRGFTALDLSNFNTSNVTDMQYMFAGCRAL